MKFRGTRGQIVSLYAIALPAMLGVLALGLDGGKLFVLKIHVQNAADAAALASSQDVGPCSSGCDTDPAQEAIVRGVVEGDVNGYSSKNGGPVVLAQCAAAWYKTNHSTDPPRNSTSPTGCYMWPYLKSSAGGDPNCLPSLADPGSFACWDQVEVRIRKPVDLEFAGVVGFNNPAYPFARSVGTLTPNVVVTTTPGVTTPDLTIPGATHTDTIDESIETSTDPDVLETSTDPDTTVVNTTTSTTFQGGTGSVAFAKSTDCKQDPGGAAFQWSGASSTIKQIIINGGFDIPGANDHNSDHIWLGKKGTPGNACQIQGSGAHIGLITGPFDPLDWPVPPPSPAPPPGCRDTETISITASWLTPAHPPGVYCWTVPGPPLSINANGTTFNGYTFYAPSIAVSSNGMTMKNAPPAAGEPPVLFDAYDGNFTMSGNSDTLTGDIFAPNGNIIVTGGGSFAGTGFMEAIKVIIAGNFAGYFGTGPGDGGGFVTTTHTTTTVVPGGTHTTTIPGATHTTTINGTTQTTTDPDQTITGVTTDGSSSTATNGTTVGLGE
jgi:hypothetical protein